MDVMNQCDSDKAKLDKQIDALLAANANTRVNGKVTSGKTMKTRREVIRTSFNNLWKLGYRISTPSNIEPKHLSALCKYWHANGIANKTMQTRLSTLRIMGRWIDKPNLVKSVPHYLPDVPKKELVVVAVAKRSKSWGENGIDLMDKFRQADELDTRFGVMLRLSLAFGLRRIEVVQFKPHKSDYGDVIKVFEAKNGRMREVNIRTVEQRQVLDLAKSICKGKLEPMGWANTKSGKNATLEQNENRYNAYMAAIGITKQECGVTGHGLRAQFAENLALNSKLIPPTLGGSAGQMVKGDMDVKRAQVSEELGHSRISVTTAYYGTFGRNVSPDEVDRARQNIEEGLKYAHAGVKVAVPEDRRFDCTAIIVDLEHLGIDLTLRQAHMMWEIHSQQRHAKHWVKPELGIAEAMEVVALKLVKQK